MKFLVQLGGLNFTEQDRLKHSLKFLGDNVTFVDVRPFSHEFIPSVDGIDWIPYGSTLFIDICRRLGYTGISGDNSVLNYQNYMTNRSDMLNGDAIVDRADNIVEYLLTQDPDKEWFVKPSNDDKQFSGGCFTSKEIVDWFVDAYESEVQGSYTFPRDTMVVLNGIKHILREIRYFIVNGKVITGSTYRINGKLDKVRVDNLTEAQRLADIWLPVQNCAMDLAVVKNSNGTTDVKVVEFNSINAAGFYECDVEMLFKSWNEEYN